MALFFIEMGQGIVVDGDVSVCTSTLYTCSLITGYNQQTGAAGAYHYPSGRIESDDVLEDMNAWATRLNPTHVTLIIAKSASTFEAEFIGKDERALQDWVQRKCGVAPTIDHQTCAAMCMANAQFSAGRPSQLPNGAGAYSKSNAISLVSRQAGVYQDHGGFTLIGLDRENMPVTTGKTKVKGTGHKPACCIL